MNHLDSETSFRKYSVICQIELSKWQTETEDAVASLVIQDAQIKFSSFP